MVLMLLRLSLGCNAPPLDEVFAAPSASKSNPFRRWHSTAVGKNHGSFGMPCNLPLAGLIPAAGGEFVLERTHAVQQASVCGVNLANNATCRARRLPLSPKVGKPPSADPELWIRAVQDTREGALAFVNELHLGYSFDLWKTERCNPATYGSRIAAAPNVNVEMHFEGAGLCGGEADQTATFSVWTKVDAVGSARTRPRHPLAIRARLVGRAIIAATCTFAHSTECTHGVFGERCTHTLRADFTYMVPSEDAGAYLLEVLVARVLTHDINHLAYRGGALVRHRHLSDRSSSADLARSRTPKALCTRGNHAGRWVRGEHARGGGGGDEDQRRAAVDDSMRFNKGYWWEPYECTYRAYSPTEMRQCLTRSRMNVLGFGGDSLGREPMADLSQVCDLRIPLRPPHISSRLHLRRVSV